VEGNLRVAVPPRGSRILQTAITHHVPLEIGIRSSTLLVRRETFERLGFARSAIDERFGLTPEEFRVEGDLVAIGPLQNDELLTSLIDEFERAGANYFDEFFELSGNWPEWIRLFAMSERT
jgi:hypothetical protein